MAVKKPSDVKGISVGMIKESGAKNLTEYKAMQKTSSPPPTSTSSERQPTSSITPLIRPGSISGPSPSDSDYFTSKVKDQPQLKDVEVEKTSSGETRLVRRTSSGGTQPVSKPTQLVEEKQEKQEEDESVLKQRQEQIKLSQKEDLEEEQKQEQIKQAIKERGVAEAVSEEPRTSQAELQEKADKTKLARQALEGLSLKGKTRQFNELISNSAREIQSNTLRSKERIGTEMVEVERQRQQLGTAVSVPVDIFQGPPKISDAERFNTFGPDAFLSERSKALTGLGGEFQQALQQNEVEAIVSRGNVIASAAQQVREQESYFNELNKVAEKYNLQPTSEGVIDVEKSIPIGPQTINGETVVFSKGKREEIKDELTELAKNIKTGEENISGLKTQFEEQNIELEAPSVEKASKLKPQTFFGGATSFFEDVRSELGKVEQAKREKKAKEPSIENVLKQRIKSGKPSLAKSVLQESEKISPTRFVASLPLGITRPLEFGEDVAREDVQLFRQALTPGKTPRKDLEKIAPIITGSTKLFKQGEKGYQDFSKTLLTKGAPTAVIKTGETLAPIATSLGISFGEKILKDPSGEIGEIVAPALMLGGAKAISSGLKSRSVTELQKVVRATDPKFFRSSKFVTQNIDDVSKIGYSRLEAGASKFLSVGDKSDDALKLAVRKASSRAKQNIDDLTKFKIQKASGSFKQKTYLQRLKEQILSEKPPVSKTPPPLDSTSIRLVEPGKGALLKQRILDRQLKANKLLKSRKDFGKAFAKDKPALDLKSLADDFLRTKQEKAILNKLKQAQLQKSWRTQSTSQKSLVEKELLARDLEILKKLQTKKFSKIAKNLGLDKGDDLSGISGSTSAKPKPPSPPASGVVSVPQKDGTMLLQKLGKGPKIDKIIANTTTKRSVDSKAFDIVRKASGESKKIFPKIKPLSDTLEKARGVQPVYGFGVPGIKAVSDELAIKLKGFRQEESSLEQVARNIGVGEIPCKTDFFKQQEPQIIKVGESRLIPQSAEQLNEQLVSVGGRNISDTSRGISKTKEQTDLVEKIGLKEKSIIKNISDVKTKTDSRIKSDIKSVSGVQQKQDVRLKQKFKQLTDTKLDLGEKIKPKTIITPKPKIKTRVEPRIDVRKQIEEKPKVKGFPFGLLQDDKKKKQLKRLYRFYEIRGEPRGGRKTKKFIGTFPLIKGLNVGARIVGRTPSRTISYSPTKFKSIGKDDVRFKFSSQFRRPSRESKFKGSPRERFLVEKTKFAISSPGEKRGITLKGIKARQSKARINFSKLGLNNRRGKNVRKKR